MEPRIVNLSGRKETVSKTKQKGTKTLNSVQQSIGHYASNLPKHASERPHPGVPRPRPKGATAELLGYERDVSIPDVAFGMHSKKNKVSVLTVPSGDKVIQKHAKNSLKEMMDHHYDEPVYSWKVTQKTLRHNAGIKLSIVESGKHSALPGEGHARIDPEGYFAMLSALRVTRQEIETDSPLLKTLRYGNVSMTVGETAGESKERLSIRSFNDTYKRCLNTANCIRELGGSGRLAVALNLLENFAKSPPPLYFDGNGIQFTPDEEERYPNQTDEDWLNLCKEKAKGPEQKAQIQEYEKSLALWKSCPADHRVRLLSLLPDHIDRTIFDSHDLRGLTCVVLCVSPEHYDPIGAARLLLANKDFGIWLLPEQETVTATVIDFFKESPDMPVQKLRLFDRCFSKESATAWYGQVVIGIAPDLPTWLDDVAKKSDLPEWLKVVDESIGSKKIEKGERPASRDIRSQHLKETQSWLEKEANYKFYQDEDRCKRVHPPTGKETYSEEEEVQLRRFALAAIQDPDSAIMVADVVRQVALNGSEADARRLLENALRLADKGTAAILKMAVADLFPHLDKAHDEFREKLGIAKDKIRKFGWAVSEEKGARLIPIAESEEKTKDAVQSEEEFRALSMLAFNAAQLPGEGRLASDVVYFLTALGRERQAEILHGMLLGVATHENRPILQQPWQ